MRDKAHIVGAGGSEVWRSSSVVADHRGFSAHAAVIRAQLRRIIASGRWSRSQSPRHPALSARWGGEGKRYDGGDDACRVARPSAAAAIRAD